LAAAGAHPDERARAAIQGGGPQHRRYLRFDPARLVLGLRSSLRREPRAGSAEGQDSEGDVSFDQMLAAISLAAGWFALCDWLASR